MYNFQGSIHGAQVCSSGELNTHVFGLFVWMVPIGRMWFSLSDKADLERTPILPFTLWNFGPPLK